MIRVFFIILLLALSFNANANANANVLTGYNRADIFNKIKRAIKSPKVPGSPNIPSALIGLGVTGIIEGIEKIQKDMENPNFVNEHTTQKDHQTTVHHDASGLAGYDYIYRGIAYSSPEQVRALMLKQIEENGWKLSRQSDGYYYQHWVVNMQNKTMRLYARVAEKDDPACAKLNNRCGWHTDFTGYIVPIGDINNKTFYNTKEKARDIALDRVINDLIDSHEEDLKTAIPTGVGTGVGADAGVGTGVGVGVGTNTGSQEATDEATQVQPRPIPTETSKPFEVPKFCTWAKHVCTFIDWVKTDPPPPKTPTHPKIKEIDKDYDINPNLYNANGQCPAPIPINIGMGTIAIPYDSLCLFFTKNSPLVVAIAYLIGAFIIIGKR